MPIAANQISPAPIAQTSQVSDPTLTSGQGTFYAKNISGVVEAFFTNGNGQVVQLTKNGVIIGGEITFSFEKSFVNGFAGIIPAQTPVAIKTDGSIVPGDAEEASLASEVIGFTKVAIPQSTNGVVILFGRSVAGALAGLGFAPGDEIFIDETAGAMTNNTNTFTGNDDVILRLGVAAMPDSTTGSAATDLIMMREYIGAQS